MPSFSVIGLAGRARSGKDTAANFIIAARGGYRYGFADPIRAMLKPLGVDMNDPYWNARKEETIPALGASPRRLMQTLGTEWGRDLIHPDLWVTLARQRFLNQGPGMVITDVRFENEAAWIRRCGGLVVHLYRRDAATVEEHSSEESLDVHATDVQLLNNGTLEDLQYAVRELLNVYHET
jgi:hypothetical protein